MSDTLEATGTEDRDEGPPLLPFGAGNPQRRRRRIWPFVLGGVFLLVVGLAATVADAYAQSYRIYRDARTIIPDLDQARASLSRGFVPSGDPFRGASDAAARARRAVDGARLTFRVTGALPFLGRPVRAVRLGVAAAEEEARAATIMRDMVRAALGPAAQPGGSASSGRPIPIFHDGTIDLKLVESFAPSLQSLIDHLRAGDRFIRAIPRVPFFHQLDRLKAEGLGQSAQAIKLANDALAAVRVLPSFLGADGSKTYYLGLENNADQRATGGDVLAWAFIRVNRGRLELLDGGGSSRRGFEPLYGFKGASLPPDYAWYVDHIDEPKAFPRLSNSNYTPDFPVVARAWAAMLDTGKRIHVDGVVALDPIAVSALLGRHVVRIPAYSKPITAANVVTVVENDQYRLTQQQQSAFPGELILAAWPAVADPDPFLPTVHRLGQALREKHLLLWSADEKEQQLLTQLRWDGGLRREPGDYLYQVDNKLRANKVDFYTSTSIAYDVTVLRSGAIRATCTVTLTNRTPPGQPEPIVWRSVGALNRALISVYVPENATLVSAVPATGLPDHQEAGSQVFIRVADASPGHPGSVRFTYTVPNVVQSTSQGRLYQLTVQHQPMVNPAQLTVRVTLPVGTTVTSAPGWIVRGNLATFRTVLTTDFVRRIVF